MPTIVTRTWRPCMSRLAVVPVNQAVSVQNWVGRHLGSIAHELRVARNARVLFTLTRRWHGLVGDDCRMLVLGAMVHDVGRAWGEKGHARRGAQCILESTTLALT